MPSLKLNLLFNYLSQFYMALIGIFMVPFYIELLGAEAYGLIAFFAMLQAWFQLLDAGLTPTMARETARYRGGACTAAELRRLHSVLAKIFLAVACVGAGVIFASAELIALRWLNVVSLEPATVISVIQMIGVIVAIRWMSGLYRGVISGFERLVWLSSFNILIASLRFVAVVPFLLYVENSIIAFFGFQLFTAMLELMGLVVKSKSLVPREATVSNLPASPFNLRPILGFSLSIAFTSSLWVLVTQSDKLLLSSLLSLSDYGYYTLAVLVASGIMIISGPLSAALLPRLSRLNAEGNSEELLRLYRSSTQFIAALTGAAALVLIFFAKEVLFAWTGDAGLAARSADVLRLYAAGNAILAVAAFPYYLQYARGELSLHVQGSLLFVGVLIPLLIWAVNEFGVSGAGWAWLLVNLLYFAVWVPRVHQRYLAAGHWRWLSRDVGAVWLPPTVLLSLVYWVVPVPAQRVGLIGFLAGIGVLVLVASAMSAPALRLRIRALPFVARFKIEG